MTSEVLSAAELRARLLRTCQLMIDSCDMLCQADRDLGDGDHGVTMARAFGAAREGLEATAPSSAGSDFSTIGAKLMGSGGTAGIVFGTWFSTLGRTVADKELDADLLAAGMTAAVQAVQTRGKVALGEKTMFDALSPAVDALKSATADGIDAALAKAAAAAKTGVEATRHMVATKGKAKTLGERSLDFPDPGAISVALIFGALSTA